MSFASVWQLLLEPSHSSGLSTEIIVVSKSFFVAGDEMIGGDRDGADKLNVVLEVGACGDRCLVEDRLAQRDKMKALHD